MLVCFILEESNCVFEFPVCKGVRGHADSMNWNDQAIGTEWQQEDIVV
jgi:hypothetical protein